jgi:hypothetical protein
MITATADQIRRVLVADASGLHAALVGLDQALGDRGHLVDMRALLESLPEAIAARGPFEDEANLVDVVQAETRRALYRLTMHALPAKGRA